MNSIIDAQQEFLNLVPSWLGETLVVHEAAMIVGFGLMGETTFKTSPSIPEVAHKILHTQREKHLLKYGLT